MPLQRLSQNSPNPAAPEKAIPLFLIWRILIFAEGVLRVFLEIQGPCFDGRLSQGGQRFRWLPRRIGRHKPGNGGPILPMPGQNTSGFLTNGILTHNLLLLNGLSQCLAPGGYRLCWNSLQLNGLNARWAKTSVELNVYSTIS